MGCGRRRRSNATTAAERRPLSTVRQAAMEKCCMAEFRFSIHRTIRMPAADGAGMCVACMSDGRAGVMAVRPYAALGERGMCGTCLRRSDRPLCALRVSPEVPFRRGAVATRLGRRMRSGFGRLRGAAERACIVAARCGACAGREREVRNVPCRDARSVRRQAKTSVPSGTAMRLRSARSLSVPPCGEWTGVPSAGTVR